MALETALETSFGRRPTRLVARPQVLHVPPESRGRTGALLERGWRSMDSAHRGGSQWGNSSRGVEGDGEAQTCVCGGEGAHARGLLAGRARSNWRRSAGRGPANTTTKAARNTTYELRACSSPMSQLFSMSLGPCLWVGVSGASHLISQRADRPQLPRPTARRTHCDEPWKYSLRGL